LSYQTCSMVVSARDGSDPSIRTSSWLPMSTQRHQNSTYQTCIGTSVLWLRIQAAMHNNQASDQAYIQ
ncbi:hypothetical protein PFISCL1PPCAC_8670, partial [Pristionchus fissidentatus]